MSDKTEALRQIRDDVVALTESPLYEYRQSNGFLPVLGQGNHDAAIMFIGEAPGENEAKQGRPFCGASGRVLDELLASINLDRGDVYVTNILKDRPPKNRDPQPEEIELYTPFLLRQIDIIQPRVIATLGRFSMEYILKRFAPEHNPVRISQVHGQVFEATASYGQIHVLPLYHPAVALYKRTQRDVLEEDFKGLIPFMSDNG